MAPPLKGGGGAYWRGHPTPGRGKLVSGGLRQCAPIRILPIGALAQTVPRAGSGVVVIHFDTRVAIVHWREISRKTACANGQWPPWAHWRIGALLKLSKNYRKLSKILRLLLTVRNH